MFSLTQVIDSHTRITASSSTTIDLVLGSDLDKVTQDSFHVILVIIIWGTVSEENQ